MDSDANDDGILEEPKRPIIGARTIEASARLSVLPWEAWSLLTDPVKLSRLWGDTIKLDFDETKKGVVVNVLRDCQNTWNIENISSVEMESIKMHIAGNPWHGRPDLVDSIFSISIGEEIRFVLDGFDISRSADASFLLGCMWAQSRLSKIIGYFGGDPHKNVELDCSIICSTELDKSINDIRVAILDAGSAVTWLADEVKIESFLGGNFWLKWNKPWGTLALKGSLTVFETDRLVVTVKDNPFGGKRPIQIVFGMSDTNSGTNLKISVSGLPVEPTSSFSVLLLSDLIQLALISYSIQK
ncbi:MAG TPA: hypothetical protein PKV16_03205 [Caldisericia bacterium]|nr:hypothetical protein [Caldisericia bacterium]HPF48319.1 hypothetical protein [Caldisericia bacterium]HPI83502.1 hypothetical protein [Caldisericia bacterium]HPQ92772.1 hypothetical protein [Caldisericia bacterium]HRV74130.1 hypothetical protein [Caldisericia bacterium]